MLLADGFNDAVIGTGERAGQPTIVVYDFDRCVAILCERDNMSIDEAVDYMYFNGWVMKPPSSCVTLTASRT
jgi:hypothetical protein